MSESIDIPKDWKLKKFEDVLDYIQPTPYIVSSVDYSDEYETPVLTAGKTFVLGNTNEKNGIFNNYPVIIFDDFTTANKFVNFSFKVKSSAMKILKPKDNDVNIKFVFYYMQTVRITFDTHKRYWISVFAKLPIPSPPPSVQQSIVSKIEELFSELDKGIEELKTAQQQFKVYRQAVLKWAFEGKLTNTDVKDGELPKGWRNVPLGEIIEQPKYGTSKKCDYKITGKGVLRIPNIKSGFVDSTDLKYANFDEQEIKTYSLKEGDLLTIRSNGSVDIVGQCALITKRNEAYLYAGYLIRLRPIQTAVMPHYLLHVFSSSNLRNQIESKAKSTSGVNNINSEELKGLNIPLCSIKQQQQIVQEIESRLSVCDNIEETITNSLKQSEALRRSILKRAFEGKLV